MRLSYPILFLTLVLSGLAANAAPAIDRQPNPIEMSLKNQNEPIYHSERTERNWSARLSYFGGAVSEAKQSEQLYLFGLRYDFLRETLSAWEVEVLKGNDNFLQFVVGKKFYFPLETVTLPYYRLSVGNLVDSTDGGLGSVLNFKKIQAIAAVGLDDLFQWDERLQGEVAVGLALVGPQFEMSLGLAF